MDQINMAENVDTLFHKLENLNQKEGVIGKAITQGEKTFMPVVSVTVGYGGGNASMGTKVQSTPSAFSAGSAASNSGTGAMGLGAKLNTGAIIVIDDQSKRCFHASDERVRRKQNGGKAPPDYIRYEPEQKCKPAVSVCRAVVRRANCRIQQRPPR